MLVMAKRKHTTPIARDSSELVLFAAKVRAGRAVLGWSQTDLADRIAVTQRPIYRIEQALTRPRAETEGRIVEAFSGKGVKFESLARGAFKMTVSQYALSKPQLRSAHSK
jgi:ribosome-binding protein aMBF1 (putative translation factor)